MNKKKKCRGLGGAAKTVQVDLPLHVPVLRGVAPNILDGAGLGLRRSMGIAGRK